MHAVRHLPGHSDQKRKFEKGYVVFEGNHYKSWSGLKKQLTERLCDELQGRVDYFLTRYHKVHNSYGRAAIFVDGKERADFTWLDMYQQDIDSWSCGSTTEEELLLQKKWNQDKILSDYDFLTSATRYLQMNIQEALQSDDYIIRSLAIMDRRAGKRTIEKCKDSGEYLSLPEWVRQFYELRFSAKMPGQVSKSE